MNKRTKLEVAPDPVLELEAVLLFSLLISTFISAALR
jgi:hypothetical protein